MDKKITLIVILILCFSLSGASAQSFDNVGTSVANFLKIGVGSRAQGMAGAYTAQSDDITSLYWNVAGLTNIEGSEFGFSKNDWIADVEHYYLAGAFPVGEFGKLGIELVYLDAGTMRRTDWTDPAGLEGRTFESSDFSFGAAFARALTDRFSFGVKLKYVREQISYSVAQGIAIDLGSQYKTGYRGMKIGMSITNFGSKMKMDGSDLRKRIDAFPNQGSTPSDVWAKLETEKYSMPLTIKMGISMNIIDSGSNRLTMNFDFRDERAYKELYLIGGEYAMLNEMFFLRGGASNRFNEGYDDGYDASWRFAFGAGLKYKLGSTGFAFDYSYSDLGILENANRYSIRLIF